MLCSILILLVLVFITVMASRDQHLSQGLEQIANKSGPEIGDSDLDDEFVCELDNDDSDVNVSVLV